jgi:hypothetical protein
MWEPQPLTTLRASTACTGITLLLLYQVSIELRPRCNFLTIKPSFRSVAYRNKSSQVTLRLIVSQSVSLGIEPHLGLMTRYLLIFTVMVLFSSGALSDERTGLAFVYDADPRQRWLYRVRVPWDSWPYFTLSYLRILLTSPPATRSVTVEVFEPASTRVNPINTTHTVQEHKSKSKLCYDRRSVDQSVLVSSIHLGLTSRFLLLLDSCVFVDVGRSLWRENGSAIYNCCWSLPAQSFLGLSPAGLVTLLYCLRFETPPTWRARSPYLYPPGTGCPS